MFYKLFIWLVLYSVMGWIYETIVCSLQQKKLVKRGFLNGPYCPIYGFGAILNIVIVGRVENPILLFFAGAVAASVLEYFTAWLLETLFRAKWWDYSMLRFNFQGRICLLGAVVFGLFSVLLLKIIHPYVALQTDRLSESARMIIAGALLILLAIDTTATVMQLTSFNEKLREMQRIISEAFAEPQDYFGRAKETAVKLNGTFRAMMKKITKQELRILDAFPRFKSIRYNDAVNRIREYRRRAKGKDD